MTKDNLNDNYINGPINKREIMSRDHFWFKSIMLHFN